MTPLSQLLALEIVLRRVGRGRHRERHHEPKFQGERAILAGQPGTARIETPEEAANRTGARVGYSLAAR
jgi:hypothetical protein